jgi:hypothetical protein
MPGQASTVGSKIGLDALSGRATQTARNTFLALLTTAPTDASTMGTMAEVTTPTTNGYTRQQVTWTDPTTTETTSNTGALTFGPFSSNLSPVTHCALVSAATGTSGDFIFWWELTSPRDPENGDSISFATGALSMSLE